MRERLKYTLSIAFIAAVLFAAPSAHAIPIEKELDIGQGFEFQQDEHHGFGYITSWSIGDVDLLAGVIKGLEPRWFLLRNTHDREGVKLVMPRYAMSFMKGPMTRSEIRRAVEEKSQRG